MDPQTRKTLNRVVFGAAVVVVLVVIGAGGTVGFFLAIPVMAVALCFFLAEEFNLRRRTPPPAAHPRPAASWTNAYRASPEEIKASREKREERIRAKRQMYLDRATLETDRQVGEGVVFSNAESYARDLARIYELEEEPWHQPEIESLRKGLRSNIELGEVKREMRRKGELPWMVQLGRGAEAKYVEMWTPKEELERTFGEEEVSRFVEIDGRLYRPGYLPGTEPPGSSSS